MNAPVETRGNTTFASRTELAAVLLTGIGHILLEVLSDGLRGAADTLNRPQQIYNLAACAGWGGYVLWRGIRSTELRRIWGLQKAHFRAALNPALLFAAPAALVLILYGVTTRRFPIPLTFWLVVALYPLWGIAQQFALQALLTKNLRAMVRHPVTQALCVAVLFSLAHFPNAWLMVLVFPAGLVFTLIFERHPNIWAIGLVHGLLGSLAYYLVLGKDPGAELLRMLGVVNG